MRKIERSKAYFIFLVLLFIGTMQINAQTSGLNFQGVARNSSGVILASQNISLRFSILNASANGTVEYMETRLVVTNAQGVFSLVIGDGSGTSNLGIFSLIDWKQTQKFLKVEMDPSGGNNFATMGTTQLQTVPYANYSSFSATAGSIEAANITGIVPVARGGTGVSDLVTLKANMNLDKLNNTSDINKPISTATQVELNQKESVANKSTASDLGGASPSDILFPTQKAVKTYIANNNVSGAIADGGITTIKLANAAVTDSKLNLTNPNLGTPSILIGTNISTLGTIHTGIWSATTIDIAHGGTGATNVVDARRILGISDLVINTQSAEAPIYSDPFDLDNTNNSSDLPNVLQANNINYGINSIQNNISGIANIAFGDENLRYNTAGNSNVAIGHKSLAYNTIGNFNTALGSLSLHNNEDGNRNTAIGNLASYSNQYGYSNTAIGAASLFSNVSGFGNTAIGANALNQSLGDENTAIGHNALSDNTTGNYNVAIGRNTLRFNTTGEGNIAIGNFSAYNNYSGNKNILIGMRSDISYDGIVNSTAIGAGAIVNENNTIQLGADGNDPDYPAITKVNTKGLIKSNGIDIYVPLTDEHDVNTIAPLDGTIVHAIINGNRGLYYFDATYSQWIPIISNSNVVDLSSDQDIDGQKTFKGQIIAARENGQNSEPSLVIDNNYNDYYGYPTWLRVGSWGGGAEYGIVGASNQFFAGTSKGDIALKAFSNTNDKKMFIGATFAGNANLVLSPGGGVGLGTAEPVASAALEVSSTTKGFLPPKMTISQRDAIAAPASGLMIFCTNCSPKGDPEFYNGTRWTSMNAATLANTTIGDQIWSSTNLNVSRYRNGDVIPQVTDPTVWSNTTTGAWCWFNNDSTTYAATYGKLYNWYAVNDPRGLAPLGWHIPSDGEWTILKDYLGGTTVAGGAMKQTGTSLWTTPNTGANNASSFTGLPAGYRTWDGFYVNIGLNCGWWSSLERNTSEAFALFLYYNFAKADRYYDNKKFGFSVRCVRD